MNRRRIAQAFHSRVQAHLAVSSPEVRSL